MVALKFRNSLKPELLIFCYRILIGITYGADKKLSKPGA